MPRTLRTYTVVAALVVLYSTPASAQRLGGQRWTPHSSADGILGVEGAETRPALYPYVGLWFTYALNPVVVVDANGDERGAVVEHLVGADLVFSIALWQGLEIGLAAPFTLWQDGDAALAGQASLAPQSGFAIGDINPRLAYRLQVGKETALALHLPILLPTSSEDDVSAYGFGVRPGLAFSQWFAPFQLLLNASFLVREDVAASDFTGGEELDLGLGLRWALGTRAPTSLLLSTHLATQTRDFFGASETPIEVRFGGEHLFANQLLFTLFVGTGLSTGTGAPDFRAGLGVAWVDSRARYAHPRFGDTDGDGIDDGEDRCMDEPEDPDQFEDEDGCPDIDNDNDQIPDWDDECPTAPETVNEINDDDGCPDFITVEEAQILTFEPIYFETDSDVIEERSHDMLGEVAAVLAANPHLAVRVEGHTDNTGDRQQNLRLSQRRAASVRRFLVERGVPEARVTSEGYGQARPIDSNRTEAGRSRNRRVEFHLGPAEGGQ